MSGRLRKFIALDPDRRLTLLRAFLALRSARRDLDHQPFRDIVGALQPAGNARADAAPDARDLKRAGDIGWAVRTASRHVPFDASCLVQVLAARTMLRKAGITGTIYIGAGQNRDDSDEKFAAHAWLKCGGEFVTGEAGHEQYAVIGVVSW